MKSPQRRPAEFLPRRPVRAAAAIRALLALLMLGALAVPAWADLGDFRSKVEDQEKKGKPASPGGSGSSEDDPLAELLFQIWLAANLSLNYADYPYAKDKYVQYFGIDQEGKWTKPYRLSVEADGRFAFDEGAGFHLEAEGKFIPLLGPRAEVSRIWDGKEYLDRSCVGGQVSLFQASVLSADLYLMYASMRGAVDRDGAAAGLSLVSYPAKPLALRARFGSQSFNTGLEFGEWGVEAGWLFERWEAVAGWRSMKANDARLREAYLGVRVHL